MTPTPDVQPLSLLQRKIVFLFSVLIFVVTVPLLVFYAIGYRFDFSGEVNNIKAVGGIYVNSEVQDIEMYINNEPVEDMRIFQNAAYIQNLEAKIHQIHTQSEGLQTWVKDLPVYPHLVTEVQSFNIPEVPQVRLVAEYITAEGDSVLFNDSTTTKFAFASTTNTFVYSTSTATTTFEINPEFVYIKTLFASSSEEKQLLEDQRVLVEKTRFTFDSATTAPSAIIEATTTKVWQEMQLTEIGDEVFAQWTGKASDIPYYFCVTYSSVTSTVSEYGQHIYDSLIDEYGTTSSFSNAIYVADQLCRTQILINKMEQDVQWFGFLPGSRDYVLIQLQDGLYVVEIDDRAWQNTQLLYPGDYLEVSLDGGRIFIKDEDYYVEVFTELQ